MSKRGAEWYKREPRAFLEGVRRMTVREIAVYAVVLDLIYDAGHETYDDPKHIASYFSDLGSASVRTSIDNLVEAGKLIRRDGFLTNKRAENEGKTREELKKTRGKIGHLGGVSSGKSRSESNKNNDLNEAKSTYTCAKDKIREDIENIEPKGSLSETSSDQPPEKLKSGKRKVAYTEAFEAFWLSYPRTPNMSKAEAFTEWRKLDADEQTVCAAAVPAFKAYLKTKPDLEIIHACRFISKRRFDGFAAGAGDLVGPTGDELWTKRLSFGRRKGLWGSAEWGPRPGQPGCLVPAHLLEPNDGSNWTEMEIAR